MRIGMNKGIRLFLLIITGLAILALSFMALYEFKVKKVKEEKVAVYTYNNKGAISYNVLLKPNILYSESSIGEGRTYISEFTDYIAAAFSYHFAGDRPADISGDYELVATVEGYSENKGSDDEKGYKTIWKKDFVVSPKNTFRSNHSSITINKNYSLSYSEYNNFSREIIIASKMNLLTKLSLSMNVNISVLTDKGSTEEAYSQSLVFPLGSSSFEIEKLEIGDKAGTIEETRTIELPVNKSKLKLYFLCLVFMFILFLFLIIFTKSKSMNEKMKELNIILKKHGSRLVAIKSEVIENYQNSCKVKCIEDLVKISDELGKPIVYSHNQDPQKISRFFVFCDSWKYEFNLDEIINEKNITQLSKAEPRKTKTKRENDLKSKVRSVNLACETVDDHEES